MFGAEILQPGTPDESGRFHAEVAIGDSKLMAGSGYCAFPPMAAAFWVYVADVEATYRLAVDSGAALVNEPADQPWGDRVAGVRDRCGKYLVDRNASRLDTNPAAGGCWPNFGSSALS